MNFTASISGLEGVFASLDQVEGQVRNGAQMIMYDATKMAFDLSQDACPVLSGELKDSGAMAVDDVSGSVTYGTDHCWYVEEGTSKMAAQPFLYPAFVEAEAWAQSESQGLLR